MLRSSSSSTLRALRTRMPRRLLRQACCSVALLCAAAAAPVPAAAQAQPAASAPPGGWPTSADVERARADMRKQLEQLDSKKIEATRKEYTAPLENGALERAVKAGRQAPNMAAVPKPQNVPKMDIATMAQQFNQQDMMPKGLLDGLPKLMVFVTFGMSDASLKKLIDQAVPARATLVLRGFHNNSLQQTAQKIRQLLGEREVAFAIDPDSFDRFGVERAPSFVLTRALDPTKIPKPCAGSRCEPADNFAMVSGDVSIEYALEAIEQRAPEFKREARVFLKKIKG